MDYWKQLYIRSATVGIICYDYTDSGDRLFYLIGYKRNRKKTTQQGSKTRSI